MKTYILHLNITYFFFLNWLWNFKRPVAAIVPISKNIQNIIPIFSELIYKAGKTLTLKRKRWIRTRWGFV